MPDDLEDDRRDPAWADFTKQSVEYVKALDEATDKDGNVTTDTPGKAISVQLDVGEGMVRIRTSGWYEDQDVTLTPADALDWLEATSDNGHRKVEIIVWSNDR